MSRFSVVMVNYYEIFDYEVGQYTGDMYFTKWAAEAKCARLNGLRAWRTMRSFVWGD